MVNLEQFESSTELENSEIGIVPPFPSNITLSSAPILSNDAPAIVVIPSVEIMNLQALLSVLFAFIVHTVSKIIQPLKSTSPTSIQDIKQSDIKAGVAADGSAIAAKRYKEHSRISEAK
ncbi:MAG: hypothetical protein EZS28_007639 [Streblomastix strix]|uniref:Uncharacterized protein n=1 Tax=Streblomastix strix TaxID=222440 RepID=A0A5J4WPG2_9EUKA|nr:MAG: hypothetical protein EZS28_007639 [Streblomastix strix]